MADPGGPGSSNPLVSVIIPTYNRAATVGRAIDSVLAQGYRPLEVIVVDDGSTDETPSVLAAYGEPVRCIRQPNRERAAARNHGLAVSSGDLVAFLDSDDEWQPEHLGPLVGCLEAGTAAAGVGTPVCLAYRQAEFFDDETGEVFDVFPRRPIEGEIFLQSVERNPVMVDSVLVRRSLLHEVGDFDEDPALSGSEDWELWTRCLAVSPIAFVPGVTVRVHYHSRNTVGNRAVMERAIRSAVGKMLANPRNQERLRPHRTRVQAGLWAFLAHIHMLAGDTAAARARLREGVRQSPGVLTCPVFWTMALKALAGSKLVDRGRLLRRRLHLRRRGYEGSGARTTDRR